MLDYKDIIVILCTDSAPSLNELVTLIVALHQLVSSQDTCALTLFRADQLITGDTGNGIQEAQVMVIQLNAVLNTMQEG